MPARPKDLRRTPRVPLRRAGWIDFGSSCAAVPCVVWDMSEEGARLTAAHHMALPESFVVSFQNATEKRKCRVVWRDRRFVGIQFVQA